MRIFVIAYFFFIAGISLLSSCEEKNVILHSSFDTEFKLESGETIYLPEDADNLPSDPFQLSVIQISDSRCPKDVICVWYGNVQVDFSFNGSDYSLCLGQCDNSFNETDEIVVNTSYGDYVIKLLEVTPYPESGETGVKSAKFIVSSL